MLRDKRDRLQKSADQLMRDAEARQKEADMLGPQIEDLCTGLKELING